MDVQTNTEKRHCRECNRAFPRRPREAWDTYSKRIYCSRMCLDVYMRRMKNKKHPILPKYRESEQS